MHEIIDSPQNLSEHADRLFQEGVRTVIRYYNHRNSTTLPSKCLTPAEYQALTDSRLNVAVVFQQRGGAGGYLDDFGASKGTRDATRALALADSIGQSDGSAIYFGVDHDFFRPRELDQLERYFAEVKARLEGRFRVGVYGSGAVCNRLRTAALAELFWLPASMGWSGSRAFLESQHWTLFQKFQNLRSDFGGFHYDGNLFNPAFADFGQFGQAPRAYEPRLATTERINGVAVYEVIARSGLRLRGGPGTDYDASTTLVHGSIVHGFGQEGAWTKVDVNGDGVTDGFVSREFIRPLSGGLPLPPAADASSPYAVAQAEMALGIREIAGRENNPRIVLYHESTEGGAAPDETAWCSSFVNYCVEQAGMTGTRSKRARSWHDQGWGQTVTDAPRPGDIVVWRRKNADVDGGHVAFFVEMAGQDAIRVLGGNQGQRVRIATYPVNGVLDGTTYSLLSIRR